MGAVGVFAMSVLSTFALYALLAWGLGLIFGQLKVVNVAHGDFAVVGAYVMVALTPHVPFVVAVIAAVVVGTILGALSERLLLSRLYERGMLATLLAMWGVAIVIRQVIEAIFGPGAVSVEAPIGGTVPVLGAPYPTYRIVAALSCLAVVGVCVAVVYLTPLGLRLRASIDNRAMAASMGIPPRLMITGAFAAGTALAVLAGALYSPMIGATPAGGVSLLAPIFFAVMLGRPGSMVGPIAGALVVAILDVTLRTFLPETAAGIVFYLALLVLIAIRPQGISWRLRKWHATSRTSG